MSEAKSDGSDLLCVSVKGGKYTVILPRNGGLKALRNGEPWRDLTGDDLVLALAQRIEELEDQNAGLLAACESLESDVYSLIEGKNE